MDARTVDPAESAAQAAAEGPVLADVNGLGHRVLLDPAPIFDPVRS